MVSVWSWQPPLILPTITQLNATSTSQMRDRAGNLLGTIVLTTGGFERSGSWNPLVGTQTL